ncbi:hypothetical protein HDU96_006776 [Phlyctochytrium bullatum]|nr:hypothetical protein HDU96_006776 [Phlyctochytrium bullatum]
MTHNGLLGDNDRSLLSGSVVDAKATGTLPPLIAKATANVTKTSPTTPTPTSTTTTSSALGSIFRNLLLHAWLRFLIFLFESIPFLLSFFLHAARDIDDAFQLLNDISARLTQRPSLLRYRSYALFVYAYFVLSRTMRELLPAAKAFHQSLKARRVERQSGGGAGAAKVDAEGAGGSGVRPAVGGWGLPELSNNMWAVGVFFVAHLLLWIDIASFSRWHFIETVLMILNTFHSIILVYGASLVAISTPTPSTLHLSKPVASSSGTASSSASHARLLVALLAALSNYASSHVALAGVEMGYAWLFSGLTRLMLGAAMVGSCMMMVSYYGDLVAVVA